MMQSSFIKEICETMSQQQSPTPHSSPHRGSSLGLWIGMVLLLTTTILGIYAIVTKQDIIFSVISFGLVVFAVPLGILQVAPSSLVQMRQTIKMGLLVIGLSLLLGSLTLNLILLFRPQVSSTSGPKPALTSTLTGIPSSVSPSAGHLREFLILTPNSRPVSIVSGSDGNFWFTEERGNKIGRITPQGVIAEYLIPTSNSIPGGLTRSSDGNLWFFEDKGNKIGRITPQGQITEFPIPTPLVPGQQNYHDMIVGPDGDIWFTEGLADKIGRTTPQGDITEFSVPPPGGNPGSLCAGPDGNLWFTDDAKHIRRITTSGMFLGEFMISTSGSRPAALTVGPDKNIWFIEPSGNRIGQITIS